NAEGSGNNHTTRSAWPLLTSCSSHAPGPRATTSYGGMLGASRTARAIQSAGVYSLHTGGKAE
ncbi:unnamed protein product, partial [Ectocarpus sp. 13 AM-2016]